jgi:hypothetical protein
MVRICRQGDPENQASDLEGELIRQNEPRQSPAQYSWWVLAYAPLHGMALRSLLSAEARDGVRHVRRL